jgi:hypothetical protein
MDGIVAAVLPLMKLTFDYPDVEAAYHTVTSLISNIGLPAHLVEKLCDSITDNNNQSNSELRLKV